MNSRLKAASRHKTRLRGSQADGVGSAQTDLVGRRPFRRGFNRQGIYPLTLPMVSPAWKNRCKYRKSSISGTLTSTEDAAK